MFAYTLEAAVASKRLDRIAVSSDDLDLRSIAAHYGVSFVERPGFLARATSALDDAVRHACRSIEVSDGFVPDVLVTMQANVPIRKTGQIDEVVRRLERLPMATAVCTAWEVRFRPEWAKVLKDEKTGTVTAYVPGPQPYRKQELPKLYMLDGAVLAVRRNVLFETEGDRAAHAWLGPRLHIVPQPDPMYSLEVDYPDELTLVEYHLLRLRHGDRWFEDRAKESRETAVL
jgi:N-acylneuraminate cytidylyltransferase